MQGMQGMSSVVVNLVAGSSGARVALWVDSPAQSVGRARETLGDQAGGRNGQCRLRSKCRMEARALGEGCGQPHSPLPSHVKNSTAFSSKALS